MKLKSTYSYRRWQAVFFSISFILISQPDLFSQTFTGYYGATQVNCIKQSADGSFLVAGYTNLSTAGGNDMYLMKTDINGNVLWKKTYGGTGDDEATSLQITSDGGFIVAGFTNSPDFGVVGYDMYLVKTDSNGDTLWSRTYGGDRDEQAASVQQTGDGGYILSGYTYSYGAGGGFSDGYLVKTDANGDTLWTKVYGGSAGDERLNSVVQCSDKGYLAAGYSKSFPSAGNPRFFVLKTDSNGAISGGIAPTFVSYFGSSIDDEATSVVQADDGGFVIAGFTKASTGPSNDTRGTGYDMVMVKLTKSGTPSISFQYHYGGQVVLDGSSDDLCYSVQKTSDGGYILGGSSYVNLSVYYWEMYMIKTDSSGIGGGYQNGLYPYNSTTSWSYAYGIYGNGDDQGYSAIQTSDGGYIIAGENGSSTIFMCKTDSLGNDCDISSFPIYEQGPLTWTLSTPAATSFKVNTGGVVSNPLTIIGDGPASDTTFDCRSIVSVLPPVANFTASDSSLCPGDCIRYNNVSQNATSYLWSFPGGTPSSSTDVNPSNVCYYVEGRYDAILTAYNSGGNNTFIFSNCVTVNQAPPTPGIVQSNDTLFCSTDTLYTSYQWYADSSLISGATKSFLVISKNGNYNIQVGNVSGCKIAVGINVTILGLQEAEVNNIFIIYPNPSSGELIVNFAITGGIEKMVIYDILGNQCSQSETNPSANGSEYIKRIDISSLSAGIYFIRLFMTNNVRPCIGKFVKK